MSKRGNAILHVSLNGERKKKEMAGQLSSPFRLLLIHVPVSILATNFSKMIFQKMCQFSFATKKFPTKRKAEFAYQKM